MRVFRNRKGQSLLEYSLILAAIVVGILFMATYVRRGVQGRLKSSGDDIGEQFSVGGPGYEYNYLTKRHSVTEETTDAAGTVTNFTDLTNKSGKTVLPKGEYGTFQ